MKFAIGLILILAILFGATSATAALLSDQGTDVREISTGNNLALGNLTILIYDAPTGGTLLYDQTFPNAIVDGSWNVMISPSLEYSKSYWKDYEINGENLDFDGNDRLEFQSPLGLINNASYFNFSLIGSCPAGSSIGQVHEDGSVSCETYDTGNGSRGADLSNVAFTNRSENWGANNISASYFFGNLNWSWLTNIPSYIKDYTSDLANKLDVSDQRYNETSYINQIVSDNNASWSSTYNATYDAKAGPGNCPSNQFVVNTTTGGVECASPSFTETEPSWNENSTLVAFLSNQGTWNVNSSAYWGTFNSASDLNYLILSYWDNITNKPTNLSQFADDLGNRGYTHLSNFTDDTNYGTKNVNSSNYWNNLNSPSDFMWVNCSVGQFAAGASGLSLGCEDLPVFNESDPVFVSENGTIWTGINLKLDTSDQRYNNTLFILDQLLSYYTKLETYNKSEVYSKTESDLRYLQNFTESDPVFILENGTIWTAINTKLNVNDQRYNDSQFILDQLANYYLKTDVYNKSEIDALFGNYYNISEIDSMLSNYYNKTESDGRYLQSYTETEPNWNGNYSSVAFTADQGSWNVNNSVWWAGYNSPPASWTDTYNATYDAKISDNTSWNESHANTLYAPISLVGDNSSWNQSLANTLYAPINYGDNWNKTYADTLYYLISNPNNYYNSTTIPAYLTTETNWNGNATTVLNWNKTYADTLYSTMAEPKWTANYTAVFNWNKTYANTLYAGISNSSYINNLSLTDCPAGQLVIGVQNNGTVLCATDATQAGSTTTKWVKTLVSTNNNTVYSLVTDLGITLDANSNYTVNCRLIMYAASASTGVQLQINTTNTPLKVTWTYNSPLSATTMEMLQGVNVATNAFADLGSGTANIRYAGVVYGFIQTPAAATTAVTWEMKSEVSSSAANIDVGSVCDYTKVT